MKLTLNYLMFAFLATAANIGTQDIVIRGYSGAYAIIISVVVGTSVGLIVKYVLDKRYIFLFRAKNAVHGSRTFLLYSLMGLATTAIFWCFELGFHYVFETKEMRYLGGVLGLIIGYLLKYRLDRRFVFSAEN